MGDASLSRLRNKEECSLYMGGRETTSTGEGEQVDTGRREGGHTEERNHRKHLTDNLINTKSRQTQNKQNYLWVLTHTQTHTLQQI